jgi:hypothetical protein
MQSPPWHELILALGVVAWSVWFDRRKFIVGLVAQAMWDYVNTRGKKPRTDLERFADGMDWLTPRLDLAIRIQFYESDTRV